MFGDGTSLASEESLDSGKRVRKGRKGLVDGTVEGGTEGQAEVGRQVGLRGYPF